MVGIKTLSLLALTGSALAIPRADPWGGNHGGNIVTENEVVYTTVVVTVTAGQEPTPTPQVQQPEPTPQVEVTPTPEPTPEAQPEPSPQPQSSQAPSSSDGSYTGVVNKYRAMLGKSPLSTDSTLEGNAHKTCQDSGGQLNHELNAGSMAQVLAPGSPDEFEKVCFGGWFCEQSSWFPSSMCAEASKGWSYDGQTGHADILASDSYTKLGCYCCSGVWACDLA